MTSVMFVSQGQGDEARISSEDNGLSWAVKYILTITGAGAAAPGVFILSDKSLGVEDMKLKKVQLLSHDASAEAFGYIIYLQNRSGNPKFWKWYMKDLVLPYIAKTKTALFGDNVSADELEDGECPLVHSKIAVFTSDGEPGQIYAVTKDPETVQLLNDAEVSYNKHNAGRSLLEQPADLTSVFRNVKGALKNSSGANVHNPSLHDFIVAALNDLKSEGVNIDAAQISRVTTGLMCIVNALVTHCTPASIKKGFERSGMVGPPDTWDDVTRKIPFGNRGVVNGQTTPYYRYTKSDWEKIDEHFDEMVQEYIEVGVLTDEYLDSLEMPRNAEQTTDKEDLAVYRWRTTMLNNPQVLEVLKDRAKQKAEAEAAAAQTRVAADVLKQQKILTAPMEQKFKDLVARLVLYRDQATTSLNDCKNSAKDAKARSSTGLSSCLILEKSAKDECAKTHSIWRAAFDEGKKTCTSLAGEGKVEELQQHLNSHLALEATAKDAVASAANAAASAKLSALLPAEPAKPPVQKTAAKRGKNEKEKQSKADLMRQMVAMQRQLDAMSTDDSDDNNASDERPTKKQTTKARVPETDDDDEGASKLGGRPGGKSGTRSASIGRR